MSDKVIKSVGEKQDEIINDIITLHLDGKDIECDPTFSTGNFYKSGNVREPVYKFDKDPKRDDVKECDCKELPLSDGQLNNMIFDPPFVIAKGPTASAEKKGRNIIGTRFSHFEHWTEMFDFYHKSIDEAYRVLKKNGVYIFKCQDTVSGGKNFMTHVEIINYATSIGFYCKDLFILTAKNRIISGKVKKQEHARKFHSYFLVFIKRPSRVKYTFINDE